MKKIEKKFEKSSNTFQKTLDVAKKKFIPPKHFQKRVEKKGKKKQKELKGGPKKSAQKSPVTFLSTQNGDNESSFP